MSASRASSPPVKNVMDQDMFLHFCRKHLGDPQIPRFAPDLFSIDLNLNFILITNLVHVTFIYIANRPFSNF
jgi:hypothetical protein